MSLCPTEIGLKHTIHLKSMNNVNDLNNFLIELGLVDQIKEYSPEISEEEAIQIAKILVENLVFEHQDETSILIALNTYKAKQNSGD